MKYVDYCTCTESTAKLELDGSYTCLTCHRPLGAYVPPLLPEEDDSLSDEVFESLLIKGNYCDNCNAHYFSSHDCWEYGESMEGFMYER